MSRKKIVNVTMRVRIGDNELEVVGPNDFVEKKIAEFLENQKKPQTFSPTPVKNVLPTSTLTSTDTKKMSAAQFFRKISPKTEVDRVLVAGYFLEKFKNADKFTSSEVSDIIRESKNRPPQNTSEAINKNIKKGFIMPSGDKDGKMAFVLTSDGEDTIMGLLKM